MGICIKKNDGTETTLGVDKFPDRKQKCLYIMRGNVVEPLAYFRSDEKAKQCQDFLDLLFELMRK